MAIHWPNPDLYGLPIKERQQLAAGIEHLHRLGPRILSSFLLEASDDPIPELIRRLDDLRRLSPEVTAALSANDWTPPFRPGRRPWRAA
jgi:hypothetical protein